MYVLRMKTWSSIFMCMDIQRRTKKNYRAFSNFSRARTHTRTNKANAPEYSTHTPEFLLRI